MSEKKKEILIKRRPESKPLKKKQQSDKELMEEINRKKVLQKENKTYKKEFDEKLNNSKGEQFFLYYYKEKLKFIQFSKLSININEEKQFNAYLEALFVYCFVKKYVKLISNELAIKDVDKIDDEEDDIVEIDDEEDDIIGIDENEIKNKYINLDLEYSIVNLHNKKAFSFAVKRLVNKIYIHNNYIYPKDKYNENKILEIIKPNSNSILKQLIPNIEELINLKKKKREVFLRLFELENKNNYNYVIGCIKESIDKFNKRTSLTGWQKNEEFMNSLKNDNFINLVDEKYDSKKNNNITSNDLNDFFKIINGRTPTRYGYQKANFFQGPHTIARCFGFNARRLYKRDIKFNLENDNNDIITNSKSKIHTYSKDGNNIVKTFFSHLYENLKVEKEKLIIKHNTNNYEFGNEKWVPKKATEASLEHQDNCYKDYLGELDKYLNFFNKIGEEGISDFRVLAYGQALCDLHPFATSFDISGKGLEGGGESYNFKRVKWIVRINQEMIDKYVDETDMENELEENEISDKIKKYFNKFNLKKGDNILGKIKEGVRKKMDIETLKIEYALKYIAPNTNDILELGLGKKNKGLFDPIGYGNEMYMPQNLKDPFKKFIISSIEINLYLLGYLVNIGKDEVDLPFKFQDQVELAKIHKEMIETKINEKLMSMDLRMIDEKNND